MVSLARAKLSLTSQIILRNVGMKALVSGWGLTDFFFGTYPQHLMDVTVTIKGRDECGELTSHLLESQFCAGREGKDSCQGRNKIEEAEISSLKLNLRVYNVVCRR